MGQLKLKSSSKAFAKFVKDVDVYSAPVYPVNEWLATDLLVDEIECRTYEQDLNKADGDAQR